MKKLLILMLLFAGCSGNPCGDFLTEDEQTAGRIAVEVLILQGVPVWVIREDIQDNPFFDEACGDYLISLAVNR